LSGYGEHQELRSTGGNNMNEKFEQLKCMIEYSRNIEPDQLYSEVVEAYEKGEIDCREYIVLYELFKNTTGDYAC